MAPSRPPTPTIPAAEPSRVPSTVVLDSAALAQLLAALNEQARVAPTAALNTALTSRGRTVKWDNIPVLSLSAPGEIDSWFVALETRLKAARIPAEAWVELFMQCPVVDEGIKAKLQDLDPLTYEAIHGRILKDYGPTDPVNYFRQQIASVRGGDRAQVRDRLMPLLTLHNRAAERESREKMTTRDLCYPFCAAFPPATQAYLLKQMAIAFQLPDPFELLFRQAPEPGSEQKIVTLAEAAPQSDSERMIALLEGISHRVSGSTTPSTNPPRTAGFSEGRGTKRPYSAMQGLGGRKCSGCGGGCSERTKCPAWGKTCRKCNQVNHYEKVCRQGAQKRPFRKPGSAQN